MAELGQYTQFKKGTTLIAEIYNIGGFGVTRDDIDVTSHDTSGNADDFIPGMKHGGEIALEGWLKTSDSSGQMQAITDCLAGTKSTYTITLPNSDASTWAATMYCKRYLITPDLKGALKIAFTMKVTGLPTWTV